METVQEHQVPAIVMPTATGLGIVAVMFLPHVSAQVGHYMCVRPRGLMDKASDFGSED